MHAPLADELATLGQLTVTGLRTRYAELFGEETRVGNKLWLIRRIAWRLQALAEGDLSQRARQRAAELANDADVRLSPPRVKAASEPAKCTKTASIAAHNENRLPVPGTIITRHYKGRKLVVTVLAHGFEFEGAIYKSLSSLAN